VVGDKGLDDGVVEYKGRRDAEMQLIPIDQVVGFVKGLLRPA
jgi:prolyl-tRNA synthetase